MGASFCSCLLQPEARDFRFCSSLGHVQVSSDLNWELETSVPFFLTPHPLGASPFQHPAQAREGGEGPNSLGSFYSLVTTPSQRGRYHCALCPG